MSNVIEFTRGDAAHHTFSMPAASWTAGGKLFFAAKPAVDDDTTDANSLINGSWSDAATTDVTMNGIAYKQYNCYFPPSATSGIASNGASSADYLGEFQFVPLGGDPITFPASDNKLDCKLYFDIKRKIV